MDGNGKKPLRTAILEFYKGKEYTIKRFKESMHRAIDGLKSLKQKEIDQDIVIMTI
jgi:hypothetical protein